MPFSSPHPCGTVGCPNLALDKFCDGCRIRGRGVERRPTAAQRGYGYKWQQYSKSYLQRHPWCVDPFNRHAGELARATVTDHVRAHKGDQVLFWDEKNHQALCGSCNSYKAASFEGGFGR